MTGAPISAAVSVAQPGRCASGAARLLSVDALRGAAILGMVLVNNPGAGEHTFATLRHAEWNGFTFADAVFPGFIFVMGMAMAQGFAPYRAGTARSSPWLRILRRSLLLVGLGLLLNALVPIVAGHLRFPGVLQRIELVYLLVEFRTSRR